jgi:hypothetical protein
VRLDFENKMKLAQTNLSRRDSLKIARRFNAGNGLACASSPAGARALARFNVHLPATQEMSAPLAIRTLKRRERRAPGRPSLRDSIRFASQPGVETPGYCRSSLRDKTPARETSECGFSLTPWLQPGVECNARIKNRFNGLSVRSKAVETAGDFRR